MREQNYLAIIVMLSFVVVAYSLQHEHTHWLPDLFGLGLALAAPRQWLAIGAVAILAIIRHSPIARGLASAMPIWLVDIALPGARDMSILEDEVSDLEQAYQRRISELKAPPVKAEILQPVAENSAEDLYLQKVEIIARAVIQGEMKLTPATQLLAGAKSGKKYQAASKILKAEIERQRNRYPAHSDLKRFQ